MPEKYLYELIVEEFGKRSIAEIQLPASIRNNLHPRCELRPYQVEAFQRFLCYYEKDFNFKHLPTHLLFNMATGSGKTLIMAGLILYLYDKGYRNFLFFVNSTNIIEKTKDNFLNPASIKYLFNSEIFIANQRVRVTPVNSFESVNENDINICFTTIQKLHIDLTNPKENSLTFEDFQKHAIVLIADEAHHMNVRTKNKGDCQLFESWEDTVERIFNLNRKNMLLEFTATHDYSTTEMIKKYRNKVLFRYDLPQFRNERYSKDIVLVQTDFDLNERILQALILNQYKQEVAAQHRLNLKPVILFKAQRTVEQSIENKKNFHRLIEGLTAQQISNIRRSNIPIIQRAFRFFTKNGISDDQLVARLKWEFAPEYCLSVNNENEKENYQILINTLEDRNNRIRAIFAVQKLNEGWDVLNLFDIVRCYEPRDTGRQKIGSTTQAEAQLIGRGARYFPFTLPDNNDRYRRKFDNDMDNELRVLEELHYHSINDSRYIAEIKQALRETGMMDETVEKELKLKEAFTQTPYYRYGVIFVNDRQQKDYRHVRSFSDLGVHRKNYTHKIATGQGGVDTLLADTQNNHIAIHENRVDIKVKDIEKNIIQSAIARNPFFTFASLRRYFPNLSSIVEFMESEDYLGGLQITFEGNIYLLEANKREKLNAMIGLLNQIESEIRNQIKEYQGSREFRRSWIREVFTNKTMKFESVSSKLRDDGFEYFVSDRDWYVFNTLYGTDEEKAFVRMFDRRMRELKEKYQDIYLIRNEGHFKIYNFSDGRAFEPDFVLFLQEQDGQMLTYQIFIEPKGEYLQPYDEWKEQFLKEIKTEFANRLLQFEDKKYRLIGVPFYNLEDENSFPENLESTLN